MADTLLDVFNAAAGFSQTVLNQQDKWNKEKAEIELTAMQNQFNTDLNNELMKIQSSNNWEDWQGQINNFMDKTLAKTGVKSDNNPYYCRNQYTAQEAKKMLDAQRVQIQAKVGQMVWNKETEHYTQLYQKNRESDRTNMLLTPQQRLDNGMKEAKMLYENGRITETAFNQEIDRLYQQTYSDAYITQVSNFFDSGIENGWSFEKIIQEVNKDPLTLKKLGLNGMEEDVDVAQLQASLKKSLKEDYAARIKDMQQDNANKLSVIYREVTAAETEQGKLNAKRKGQALLKTMEGGFKLDESSFNEYAYKFNIDPAKVSKGEVYSGAGGNGGGSKGGSKESEKAQLWTYWEKAGVEMIVNDIMNGQTDLETAEAVLQDWYADKIDHNLVKDIQGATPEERDLFIAERGKDEIDNLSTSVLNAVFKDPRYAETKNKMDNLMKDISKNPDKYGETTYTWVLMNVLDLAVNTGLDSLDPRDVNTLIDKWSNSAYAEKLENVSKKYKTNSYGMAEINNTKQRNDYFMSFIEAGENNDVVYGDKNGIKWKSEKDKAEFDKGVKTMQYDFATALGIQDPSKIKVSYKKDENGDEIPIPVFTYNGMSYYPETIKDKKGNVIDYQYRNVKNNSTMSKRDYIAPGENQKKAIKNQREAAAANERVAGQKVNEVINNRQAERGTKVENLKKPPKVVEYINPDSKTTWTDDVQKGMTIQNAIPEITKKIESIRKISNPQERSKAENDFTEKIGINFRDFAKKWDSLNNDQKKYDYILTLN